MNRLLTLGILILIGAGLAADESDTAGDELQNVQQQIDKLKQQTRKLEDRAIALKLERGEFPKPLAMDGYCPVTLADHKDARQAWQRGDEQWKVMHDGREYYMLTREKMDQFMENPEQYAPVFSCLDIVRYVDKGELVEGQRGHGLTFNRGVYLFADEDSLARFSTSPDEYAAHVKPSRARLAKQRKLTSFTPMSEVGEQRRLETAVLEPANAPE